VNNTIYLDPNMVPATLRGGYSGKKFQAQIVTSVTVPSHAGLWDGGSRDTYRLIDMATGEEIPASDNMSAPWDPRKDREIVLKPGYAVVRSCMFRGKDMGLTFYVHPDNANKLIAAPTVELTPYETTVLETICSKKSSYAGKDRYEMAHDDCVEWGGKPNAWGRKPYGLSDDSIPFPTRAQWDEAKALLISKGLLNRSGAVTPAGRNARLSAK